tara:strand:- start:178 stop:291 length:114 start_codon:yes stop_codon:yes gene_type:complete
MWVVVYESNLIVFVVDVGVYESNLIVFIVGGVCIGVY